MKQFENIWGCGPQHKLKFTMWPSPWNIPFQWPSIWKGWTPLA